LAFWLRNYWALVLGALAGNAGIVVLSYMMHPFRPRLSLVRFKEIWHFSQWILFANIGNYTYGITDRFVVGGTGNTSSMGVYSVGSEIAELPALELISPISRVVMPGYAKLKHDRVMLQDACLKVLGVTALLALPAAVGVVLVANEVVRLFLGPKWLDAIPIVQWIALSAGVRAISGFAGNLMIVLGRAKELALAHWAEVVVLGVAAAGGGAMLGIVGIAIAKFLVSCSFAVVFLGMLTMDGTVSARHLLKPLWRPALATGMMGLGVEGLSQFAITWAPSVVLVAKVSVGATLYMATLYALWKAQGKPQGAEAELLTIFKERLGL
jgi:O-antigen/teichoic acid export membrane protein